MPGLLPKTRRDGQRTAQHRMTEVPKNGKQNRGGGKPLSEQLVRTIRRLWKEGNSTRMICHLTGVSIYSVDKYTRGLPSRIPVHCMGECGPRPASNEPPADAAFDVFLSD